MSNPLRFGDIVTYYDNNNPESILEAQNSLVFWDTNAHLISARRPELVVVNKHKRTCRIVDFAVSVEHRVKLEDSEKSDRYLNIARELE